MSGYRFGSGLLRKWGTTSQETVKISLVWVVNGSKSVVFGVITNRVVHTFVLSCPGWSQTGLANESEALIPKLMSSRWIERSVGFRGQPIHFNEVFRSLQVAVAIPASC